MRDAKRGDPTYERRIFYGDPDICKPCGMNIRGLTSHTCDAEPSMLCIHGVRIDTPCLACQPVIGDDGPR